MKGFPNQVADLQKLATGMGCVVAIIAAGENARDDGVLGEELVSAGVAGTGHTPIPVNEYLRLQRAKPRSSQSYRTTARGLRELYRLLGLIVDADGEVTVTDLGDEAAGFADADIEADQIQFWRRVILDFSHDGGDCEESHPYQVLLRLVGRVPGISRGKCALALEARNDSPEELDRIVALAALSEPEIRACIGVSESNWDNAKKVLPSFAQQLGDVEVEKRGGEAHFTLVATPAMDTEEPLATTGRRGGARAATRRARQVGPDTIGRAGTTETFDEVLPRPPTAADVARADRERRDRLRRHNLIVQALARHVAGPGVRLFEDPFDLLAVRRDVGVLVEVKSLNGTAADERDRVREALGQLLYYEAFAAQQFADGATIEKIACFESEISIEHRRWLNAALIGVIWKVDNEFDGDDLARRILGPNLDAV